MNVKSWLFGPAARLDFVAKFAAAGADVGILDLEDATAASMKAEVRAALAAAPADLLERSRMRLLVRANPVHTDHFPADVAAAAAAGADGIVVPMIGAASDLTIARSAMDDAGMSGRMLVGGIETAAGVANANAICAAGAEYVYFGAEDFIADTGGRRTPSNAEVQTARSLVVLAAAAAGIGAIDQVVVDINDHDRFRREASEAADLGYRGKLCIHPSQVPLANEAFRPSASDIAWAAGVVEAAEAAAADGRGVTTYEGAMIDAPLIERARRILTEAEHDQGQQQLGQDQQDQDQQGQPQPGSS